MFFLVLANDNDNSLEIRLNNRDKHLEFIKTPTEYVKIKMGGPVFKDSKMVGSRLILEANNIEDVRTWLSLDPYNKAGLFKNVEIEEIKIVIWE